MTGKRKRDAQVVGRLGQAAEHDHTSSSSAPSSTIFRQYFESHFEPLPGESMRWSELPEDGENDDSRSEGANLSDWEGLSEEESIDQVEVVEYGAHKGPPSLSDDLQLAKAFMSTKPPALGDDTSVSHKHKKQDEGSGEETAAETINLKHDLDLQRLLQESHLLDRSPNPTLPHSHRHRAIDLRMQSLGAKSSLFAQEKMPLSHRKGIVAKAKQKEASRRREAKENGIILEKETTARKGKGVRRERGIGGPAIGRFSGGTLELSSKDINDIQGRQRIAGTCRKRRK